MIYMNDCSIRVIQSYVQFSCKKFSCKFAYKNYFTTLKSNIISGGQEMAACDGKLMAEIFMMTIQVNLCCLLQVSLGLGIKLI